MLVAYSLGGVGIHKAGTGNRLAAGALLLTAGVLLISILVVPWQSVFPGVLVSSENQSFFSRYSAYFNVLGIFLALAGIALSIFFWRYPFVRSRRSRKRRSANSSSPTAS
jgi:hypothetical protein